MQQTERGQRATEVTKQWQLSAEMWREEAKAKHKEKVVGAAVCTGVLTFLGLIFLYMWIVYEPPVPPPPPPPWDPSTGGIGETGLIPALTHEWHTVHLNERYEHPIIFGGVPTMMATVITATGTSQSPDQSTVRIRDIVRGCQGWRGWCFDIRLQEPPCVADQGLVDPGEEVAWMAVDQGTYHLHGGQISEDSTPIDDVQFQAGNVWAEGGSFVVVATTPFLRGDPTVLTQVQTYNGPDFVKSRQRPAIGYMGGFFEVKLEPHQGGAAHPSENVGFFAIEATRGQFGQLTYEALTTPRNTNHNAHSTIFALNFTSLPLVFGNIASYYGGDPAVLRKSSEDIHHVELMIQEDNCGSSSNSHTNERVSMLILQQGVLRAERMPDPTVFCSASNSYFKWVDAGQFISWSLAKQVAEAHAATGPSNVKDGSAHLATISLVDRPTAAR